MSRARLALPLLVLGLAVAAAMPTPGLGLLWRVEGSSMEPTIGDGSLVVVDQVYPQHYGYRRGDVVILSPPGKTPDFPFDTMIKRVIAVPGEVVRVGGGVVEVDGEILVEPYLPPGRPAAPRGPSVTTIVPDGAVFVLGDHRTGSYDSTAFGAVPLEQLHGRVMLIVGTHGVDLPGTSPVHGAAVPDD